MAVVKNDNWVRKFEVTDPKKHKKGFTVYKVTSVVFPKSAPEASTSVIVWKRYNDFKKLHKSLQYYHKHFKINEELPQLCKEKYFNRFEDNVIKDRINFALELLNFIGRHKILFTSDPFLQFFNNGYNINEIKTTGDDIPDICSNGNSLDLSSDYIQDSDTESSPGKVWNQKSNTESTLTNNDCSDDDSNMSPDTPDSASPLNSVHCHNLSLSNLEAALDMVDSPNLLFDDKIIELDGPKALQYVNAPAVIGEMVTCYSEKPMEICLSVRTEDFRSSKDPLLPSDLSEVWITPPGTPAAKQDYLVEAAYHVGQAQKYEVDGDFEAAFCFYKAAIACLLSGAQDDNDKLRRQAVKEKTNQYLQRAEKIYAQHLASEEEFGSKNINISMEELKMYKVLGVIDSVMLTLNTSDNSCYIIKVLQKSPCPVDSKKKTILPYNVPYMVKLIKYFENENSIFLVLEYAKRGKLWDCLEDFSASKTIHENEFYSCSSSTSQYDFVDLCTKNTKVHDDNQRNSDLIVPSIKLHLTDDEIEVNSAGDENNFDFTDSRKEDFKNFDLENLEVDNLVENSQKLLSSVNRTLENSEKLTSYLSKELNDIESVFNLKCRLLASEKIGFKVNDGSSKKRSRSAIFRPKIERCYSSEDVSDSKPRTASNSIDRRSDWSKPLFPNIPEEVIRRWAAELLVSLETLHRWGIICRDLHPGNILLGEDDHILLTFQSHWKGVDSFISESAISEFYSAPENLSVFPITPAADWWSFGALLHYLLTGETLSSCYPEGIRGHTILTFPDNLSPEACSLLKELLRYEPGERLGSGINGAEEIKSHPFFNLVDWQVVYNVI